MTHKNKTSHETGRSMVETLGVLALLVLLTLGGLKLFERLHSGSVAKDLTTAIAEEAGIRYHELMAKNTGDGNIVSRQGPHGIEVQVENGTTGTLEDYFWVSTSTVSQNVCESLLKQTEGLKSAQPRLIEVTTADGGVVNCNPNGTELKFMFQKSRSHGGNGGSFKVKPKDKNGQDCPERVCPVGASCTADTITCLTGYYKSGTECGVKCVACKYNEYTDEDGAAEPKICEEPKVPNARHTDCICKQTNTPCEEGGESGLYNDQCDCIVGRCTENRHCLMGEECEIDDLRCEPCTGLCPTCPDDKPYFSGTDEACIECRNDHDCGDNQQCSNSNQCESVCNDKSTYDKNSRLCVCNEPNYYGTSYAPGATDTCRACQYGYDHQNDTCYACAQDSHCAEDEYCTENHTCKKVCDGFTATPCQTACNGINHEVAYTYAGTTVYFNNDSQTHKHCGDPKKTNEQGQWVCDSKYYMNASGNCVNGCTGFTATTCTTACAADAAGQATLTYAGNSVSCGTNKVCNGAGSCVCKYGTQSNGTCRICQANTKTGCSNNKTCNSNGTSCSCLSGEFWNGTQCTTCPSNATCNGTESFTCSANYYKNGNVCSACTGSGLKKSGTIQVCPNKCFRTFTGDKNKDGRLYGTVTGNGSSHTWSNEICVGRCTASDFWCPGHTTTKGFTFSKTGSASTASGWVIIDKPPNLSNKCNNKDRWNCPGTSNCTCS